MSLEVHTRSVDKSNKMLALKMNKLMEEHGVDFGFSTFLRYGSVENGNPGFISCSNPYGVDNFNKQATVIKSVVGNAVEPGGNAVPFVINVLSEILEDLKRKTLIKVMGHQPLDAQQNPSKVKQ